METENRNQKQKTKLVAVRMPIDVLTLIDDFAAASDRDRSKAIIAVLRDFFEK
jgi:hypothetical protein